MNHWVYVVPQGSVSWPLIFYAFILANYAHESIRYTFSDSIDGVNGIPLSCYHIKCYENNYLNLNTGITIWNVHISNSNDTYIHQRNIEVLAVKEPHSASSLTSESFRTKTTKYGNTPISRNVKTVYYGTESISYLAPKIWVLIPNDITLKIRTRYVKTMSLIWVQTHVLSFYYQLYSFY